MYRKHSLKKQIVISIIFVLAALWGAWISGCSSPSEPAPLPCYDVEHRLIYIQSVSVGIMLAEDHINHTGSIPVQYLWYEGKKYRTLMPVTVTESP